MSPWFRFQNCPVAQLKPWQSKGCQGIFWTTSNCASHWKLFFPKDFLRFRTPRSGQPKKTCHVHVFCHRFEHRENGVVSFFHFSRQETRCTSKIRGLKITMNFWGTPFLVLLQNTRYPFRGGFTCSRESENNPSAKLMAPPGLPKFPVKKSRNAATLEWKRWVFASDPAFQRKMVEWTLPTVVIWKGNCFSISINGKLFVAFRRNPGIFAKEFIKPAIQ